MNRGHTTVPQTLLSCLYVHTEGLAFANALMSVDAYHLEDEVTYFIASDHYPHIEEPQKFINKLEHFLFLI